MDEGDYAQAYQERLNEAALAARQRLTHGDPRTVAGERVCRDCGEVLDHRRLAAAPAAVRCVPCQEEAEHRELRGT